MKDNPPNSSSGLSRLLMERDYTCGRSREQIKERWGELFDDKIWQDIINKPVSWKKYSLPAAEQCPVKDEPVKSAQPSPDSGGKMLKSNWGNLFEIYGDKPFMVREGDPYTNLFPTDEWERRQHAAEILAEMGKSYRPPAAERCPEKDEPDLDRD
jgi:hypothetical protein